MTVKSDVKSRKGKPTGGRISIGVATRRRPAMLEQCLRSLAAQAVPAGTELVIVVVENDSEECSKGVVAAVERQSPIPIEYHLERNIGISDARNAVLDAAIANGSDYLAFIDDDELAYPEWISRLFAAMRNHGAMIAGGPINCTFQCKEPPVWATRHFRSTQSVHGGWPKIISGALPSGTGNLLLDLSPVRQSGIRFDKKFNLTGGEDLAFVEAFSRAVDLKSVYVNDALVCEVIPESRMTRSYIFKRNLWNASLEVSRQRGENPGFGFIVRKLCSGMGLIVLGGFCFALTYFVNSAVSETYMMMMSRGIGILSGLLRYHPRLYRKVTGN